MVRAGVLGCLLGFLLLAGCGQGNRGPEKVASEDEPLEIEDVAPPVDAGLTTEDDAKGRRIVSGTSGVSGVLPGDFPRDFPMHEPASIVDFGDSSGDWSYVDLETVSSRSVVAADLERRAPSAGWSMSDSGPEGFRASRAGVEVRVSLTDSGRGTRIRIEYR